jgi:hypothetical protein
MHSPVAQQCREKTQCIPPEQRGRMELEFMSHSLTMARGYVQHVFNGSAVHSAQHQESGTDRSGAEQGSPQGLERQRCAIEKQWR